MKRLATRHELHPVNFNRFRVNGPSMSRVLHKSPVSPGTLVSVHTRHPTHWASHFSGHSGVTEMTGMGGGSRKVMEGLLGYAGYSVLGGRCTLGGGGGWNKRECSVPETRWSGEYLIWFINFRQFLC